MKQTFINIVEGAKTVPTSTWKFLIAFFIVVVNSVLLHFGLNPLPFSESSAFVALSDLATTFITLYGVWRNNSITPNAQVADKVLDGLNSGAIKAEEVEKLV